MAKHSLKSGGSRKKYKTTKNLFDDDQESSVVPSPPKGFAITVPHKHNPKQKEILSKMLDPTTHMLLIDGLWGTSKSYLAILAALKLLQQGEVEKIYYIRSPCESSNTAKVGTLPGGLEEKMQFYNIIINDKLEEFVKPLIAKELIESKTFDALPPSFLRGRSFNKTVLICDESSNFSFEDILLICTRMGEGCKMFMVGDSYQNDVGKKSGFLRFFHTMNDQQSKDQGIHCYEMKDPEDIVRSGIIRYVMEKTGVLKT
jgi:phosphate starvation-inducible PhoH-like protein